MLLLFILLITLPTCNKILSTHIYFDLQGLPNDGTHAELHFQFLKNVVNSYLEDTALIYTVTTEVKQILGLKPQ